jgi:hypothetical protein
MPRKISVTDDQLIDDLKSLFGSELSAGDIRGYCASKNLAYPTVTRRLEQFKTSRGRWNLEITPTVVGKMEQAYQAPAALPAVETKPYS